MRALQLPLLTSAVLLCCNLHAAEPTRAQKDAAYEAASAWLAILDTGDFGRAGAGLADEWYATLVNLPTQDRKVQSTAAILAQSRNALGVESPYKVVRTLKPGGASHVTSCQCGIRDGDFYVFSYDVRFKWNSRLLRSVPFSRQADEILYVLQEKDGSWKPVSLFTKAVGGFGH